MIFKLLFLCILGFPCLSSANGVSLKEVESFMSEMQSEKIYLPSRPPLFNHYYRSKEVHPTALVFLPGMGESALKYYDLGRDLSKTPTTLYMWDHLGQGLSTHLLPSETAKIHIDSFDTHLLALENFFSVLKKKHKQIFVIGHSMGGHLAVRLALRHPDYIQKLALSSPLVDLNYDTLPIQYFTWLLDYLPGEYYPPLHSYFQSSKAKGSYVTKSEDRVKVLGEIFKKYPAQKREGATIGWLRSALRSIAELKKANASELAMPIYIAQAEKDFLVSTRAQDELCKKAQQCQKQVVPDSYHELLFEKEPARSAALDGILKFFNFRPAGA